ncbi:hypothetical protein Btru_024238 [Bulinus truncatus]|nr:hypothetical protein Btru_024238 [Bulinus truncatus]
MSKKISPRHTVRARTRSTTYTGHTCCRGRYRMNRESNKKLARHVINAIKALKDTRGSTTKDIRKYLVSQGQLNDDMDIKPAILSALKYKQLSRPQGSRGRFLFWDEGHKSGEHGSSSKRQRCGKRRRRRSCCKRRRRCRRRRPRCCRRRRRRCCLFRKGHHKLDRRSALKKISSMKIPSGKQLIVFCARRRKRK